MNIARCFILAFIAMGILTGCGGKKDSKKLEAPAKKIKKQTPQKVEDSEEGSFSRIKIKNWKTSKDKKVEVKDDSDNVSIEDPDVESNPSSAIKNFKVPPRSLAAKISSHSKIISWAPKWHYSGTGGPWLPDAALSADSSIIAIVETTGQPEGPFGSRIILIDTYNWEIAKILDFNDKKIEKICFIPESTYIACWSSRQVELKQANMFFIANCRNSRIRTSTKAIRKPVLSMTVGIYGQKLFVLESGTDKLYFFENINDLSKCHVTKTGIQTDKGSLAVSPDNVDLALAAAGQIKYYDIESRRLTRILELSSEFKPCSIKYLGENRYQAVIQKNGSAYFIRSEYKKKIANLSGSVLFYIEKDQTLAIEKAKRNEIVILSIPEMDKITSFSPASVKPKTKYPAIFAGYLPQSKDIVLLDKAGNLMLLYKLSTAKKWKKKMIFSAHK